MRWKILDQFDDIFIFSSYLCFGSAAFGGRFILNSTELHSRDCRVPLDFATKLNNLSFLFSNPTKISHSKFTKPKPKLKLNNTFTLQQQCLFCLLQHTHHFFSTPKPIIFLHLLLFFLFSPFPPNPLLHSPSSLLQVS